MPYVYLHRETDVPLVETLGNVRVYIHRGDHGRPHFHVYDAEHAAKISISDRTVIAGHLPTATLRRVRRWARQNQGRLAEKWIEYAED